MINCNRKTLVIKNTQIRIYARSSRRRQREMWTTDRHSHKVAWGEDIRKRCREFSEREAEYRRFRTRSWQKLRTSRSTVHRQRTCVPDVSKTSIRGKEKSRFLWKVCAGRVSKTADDGPRTSTCLGFPTVVRALRSGRRRFVKPNC